MHPSLAEQPAAQAHWRDGLNLLVEIVTPGGVSTMSLPLAESAPGEGFNIAAGLSWQIGNSEQDTEAMDKAMDMMMEAGGFDQCSFGACHLRRASDEKTCRLTYPLEESKQMRAEHQAVCNWRLGGNEAEGGPLFYELLHGRDMLLFADMLVEQGLLLTDQEGSMSAKRPDMEPLQLKSQLELQWYSGYNDCLEVMLGFSMLSAETDEWSGVSPADGKMQRVLRALDWQ